jgi:hypothetical protein
LIVVEVVERLNRITNSVLVDLAGSEFGIGSDRIIRLTVAEVVEVEVDRIDLFPAAAAVVVDRIDSSAVLEVV